MNHVSSGLDLVDYGKVVLALIAVLAAIGLSALLVNRLGGIPGMPRRRTGQRRLAMIEVLPVDAKRRLLLVSRDDVEHLLLLGPEGDLLIESTAPGFSGESFAQRLDQADQMPPDSRDS